MFFSNFSGTGCTKFHLDFHIIHNSSDDIKQTLDRRRVLEEYYSKVKDNLQTTGAVSETEINDFRKEAEACLKDLGTERYTVLILGKSCNSKLETFPIVPRPNSGVFCKVMVHQSQF